jgi:hypothetical protein
MAEMVCSEFVERVTEYLERALPADQLARVEAHLSDCSLCELYLQQVRTTRGVSARVAEGEPQPDIDVSDLMAAYRRWTATAPDQ